jgi:hypothetical protein
MTIDSPLGESVLFGDATKLILEILDKLGFLLCGFGIAILGTVVGKRENA